MKQWTSPLKRLRRHLFNRLYLVYSILTLCSLAALGIFMATSMSGLIIKQTLNHNRQQLVSLEMAYSQQAQKVTFLKEKLGTLQTGKDTTLYDSVKHLMGDMEAFKSVKEYETYMGEVNNLFTFFDLVQNSAQTTPAIMLIHGTDGSSKFNFFWPYGTMVGLTYSNEISKLIPNNPDYSNFINIIPLVDMTMRPQEKKYYVFYDYLTDIEDDEQIKGYISIGYESQNLNFVFESYADPLEGTAYIVSDNGYIIYDSDGVRMGEPIEHFDWISETNGHFERSGMLYNVIRSEPYGFYAVGVMDKAAITRQVQTSNRTIVVFVLISSLFAILATYLSTKLISRRIAGIQQSMSVAQTGDLTVRAAFSKNDDELDNIAKSLNHMIEQLQLHIEAEYISEISRKNVELKLRETTINALQSQINPHFLYNTLETIRMQAITNRDLDVALLIEMLANLFRRRIKNGSIVSVEDELIYCDSLIHILGARYSGELEIALEVDEPIKRYAMLKDLLQPLIENAFIHGFYGWSEDEVKSLRLTGVQEGSDLIFTVTNSGTPLTIDEIDTITARLEESDQKSGHIGLKNVHQRIRLVYGGECGIVLSSNGVDNTEVSVRIKALTEQELLKLIEKGGN